MKPKTTTCFTTLFAVSRVLLTVKNVYSSKSCFMAVILYELSGTATKLRGIQSPLVLGMILDLRFSFPLSVANYGDDVFRRYVHCTELVLLRNYF